MKYIDLHLHSSCSDGLYSPRELIKRAKKEGLAVIALTDHQTIDGIEEAMKFGKKHKIKVIPAVEINDALFKGYHFHVLGYGIDWKDKNLNRLLRKMQKQREGEVKKCLQELQGQCFKLDEKEILKTVSKCIGVDWIVSFLKKGKNWQKIKKDFKLKRGQILTFSEIFKKYFIKDGKQIFPPPEISLEKVIKTIKKARGIPILAHPSQQLSWRDDWLFPLLKNRGLQGLEAISSHHNWANIEHYQKIAKELKLLITIGSDFHGDLPDEWLFPLKSIWQYFKVGLDKYIRNSLKFIIRRNL